MLVDIIDNELGNPGLLTLCLSILPRLHLDGGVDVVVEGYREFGCLCLRILYLHHWSGSTEYASRVRRLARLQLCSSSATS
jgi:DNA polymerase/3'-5' exonuclease PolX